MSVLVRGVGDIGSAVAHCLFLGGFRVVLHDEPLPATTRRGMAFADAVFDGEATLDGVQAKRANDVGRVRELLDQGDCIPVYVQPWDALRATLRPQVIVDARMRKHATPEVQLGHAALTVSLGPALVAGRHADVVIETSWDELGKVITNGASLPLRGEPKTIAGHSRDRYVYAPVDGQFRTKARVGDTVRRGEEIAHVDAMILTAPLDGVLRGLTHDNVPVTVRTKVIEIDPRGRVGEVTGIAERPRRIAEGVLSAIRDHGIGPRSTGVM